MAPGQLTDLFFVAKYRRAFIDLALGTTVVHHCALLRVIKDFHVFFGGGASNLAQRFYAQGGHKTGHRPTTPKSLDREPGKGPGIRMFFFRLLCDLSAADDSLERTNG
jgi:hypothetical protein